MICEAHIICDRCRARVAYRQELPPEGWGRVAVRTVDAASEGKGHDWHRAVQHWDVCPACLVGLNAWLVGETP